MNFSIVDLRRWQFGSAVGKGTTGCFVFLLLLGIAVLVGFKLGPDYYSYSNFRDEVKTEASRAGAHFLDDDTIIKEVLDLARKNEIRLKREDVKVERLAGQVFITIRYSVPQDIYGFQRIAEYEIKVSSYIGRL